MNSYHGRVVLITGAGRGIGREHALLFGRLGAHVVVNDLPTQDGEVSAAESVAREIETAGGKAIANTDDVADWEGARRMIDAALTAFGSLDVLVNNAGILRDRSLAKMSEQEFDDVIRVNLKGQAAPMRWAASYWRSEASAGRTLNARVVMTSSGSGLFGNAGQGNYAAAKAGVAALSLVAARELDRIGVKVNAIAPAARTRLTENVPVVGEIMRAPESDAEFDFFDPANISPLVAYLGSASCQFSGHVFGVIGGRVVHYDGFSETGRIDVGRRWLDGELDAAMSAWDTTIPPIPEP
jgi:NAD(P)-dependent dehydrogenase (short-subunit alcohol dehydrogenase family)